MEGKLLERIRRCLALATSAAGTPEGDVAMERAISMASRHGIDISSIDVQPHVGAERFFFEPAANSMWRAVLANEICKYVGMEMLRDKNRFHLMGRKTDMETWRGFYIRAEKEIDEEGKRYVARYGGGKSDGDTFRKGAASGFGDRLAKYKREAEQSDNARVTRDVLGEDNGKNALVMIGRSLEVRSLKDKLYPNTKTYSVQSKGSHHARSAGYQFGSNLGVHRGNLR